MKTFFYTVSVITIITWAVSYFVYEMDAKIHFLLVLAIFIGLMVMITKR